MKEQQLQTKQRGLRIPATLDNWLEERAREKGFRSVQEFMLDIIRERREAEESRQQESELQAA